MTQTENDFTSSLKVRHSSQLKSDSGMGDAFCEDWYCEPDDVPMSSVKPSRNIQDVYFEESLGGRKTHLYV